VRFVAIFETEVVGLFRFGVHAASMPQVARGTCQSAETVSAGDRNNLHSS